MSANTCHDCPFSRHREAHETRAEWRPYECRRRAPVTAVDSDGDQIDPWPIMGVGDWCGDHPERDSSLKAARLNATSTLVLAKLMDCNGNELAGRTPAIYGLEAML